LTRLSYLPTGAADGIFGAQTWHAVVAFQGWSHLARDGIVGPLTRSALTRARRPIPWSTATGIEIHIAEQVLLMVRNGTVQRAIHVSTGARGTPTPLGHYRIYLRDPMSWSYQFHTWMPLAQYFYRGYAIHQYASVPAYPASHGCVRLPATEARAVWQFSRVGMRVWTRGASSVSARANAEAAHFRGCR
jgi:peptidoglycan hydrolase-like protein with peptidoglycan-binding domain